MTLEPYSDKDAEITGTMGLFTTEELANLHRSIVSLVSALDSSEVVRNLVNGSIRVLGAHFGYLLVQRGEGDLTLVEHKGIAKPNRRDPNAEQVFASGVAAFVNSGDELGASLAGDLPLPKGLVYAPIKGTKQRGVAAVLAVGSYDRTYTFKEVNALNLMVKPAAVVLDNAQLYENSKELSRRLRLQTDIQRVLTTVSLDRAFPQFAAALKEVIEFDVALLLGYEPTTKSFVVSNAWARDEAEPWLNRRVEAEGSFHATRLASSVTKVVDEIPEDNDAEDARWLREAEMHSGVLTRLQRKSTSIGIFSLWSRSPAFFDNSQTEILKWLGRQLALALENHRLFLQLERAKQEWEATFDAMKDSVWITDQSRSIRRFNNAFRDAVAISTDKILGATASKLLGYDEDDVVYQKFGDEDRFRFELTGTRLGGVVEVVGTKVRIADSDDGGMVFVARDVTQLQQDRSRLEQVDRLVALGHLAAAMAHEITNPLSYIKANLHFLWEKARELGDDPDVAGGDAEDEPEVTESLRALLKELPAITSESLEGVARVQGVVEKLQVFARGRQQGPGTFQLNELIDFCLTLVWALLRPRTEVVTKFTDMPPFFGDQQRLTQVLVNLLTNAAQSMNPASATKNVLEVSTSYEHGFHRICINPQSHRSVTTGRRSFEPYFAGEQDLFGTGLGLEISLEIIRDMGGEVVRSPSENSDITFTVILPGRGRRSASSVKPATKEKEQPRNGSRVLVVDDEQFVRRAMKRILSHDYDVELASDAESALAMIEQRPDFSVILCDVVMPGRSGIDLYNDIKERWPDLEHRVVFITGGVFSSETEAVLQRSANPVLRKPVEPDELLATVRAVVEKQAT